MTEPQTQTTEPQIQFRSGFVTLVGRPNSGKSTLINAVIGKKVAITSNTPQTTRHRFRAVLDTDDFQLVLVDTPGLHKPIDALGEELNHSTIKALESVDVIAMLVDVSKRLGKGDIWIMQMIKNIPAKKVLVISKTDLAQGDQIDNQIAAARQQMDWDDVVVLSAVSGFNIDGFVSTVTKYLPEGPRWFPSGTTTDQPLGVIVAEFIREKILLSTFDEVPHAVGVQVDELEYDAKRKIYSIYATIYVERDSQKGIIIGKKGDHIKAIGTQARLDLAHFLADRVYLDLRVKVRKGWRKDASQIRRFGYGEGL